MASRGAILDREARALAEELVDKLDRDRGEAYEERAAIMEFEGGLPRWRAEAFALAEIMGATAGTTGEAAFGPEALERARAREKTLIRQGWPEALSRPLSMRIVEREALAEAASWFWRRERALDAGKEPPAYPAWIDPALGWNEGQAGSVGGRSREEVAEAFAMATLRPSEDGVFRDRGLPSPALDRAPGPSSAIAKKNDAALAGPRTGSRGEAPGREAARA